MTVLRAALWAEVGHSCARPALIEIMDSRVRRRRSRRWWMTGGQGDLAGVALGGQARTALPARDRGPRQMPGRD